MLSRGGGVMGTTTSGFDNRSGPRAAQKKKDAYEVTRAKAPRPNASSGKRTMRTGGADVQSTPPYPCLPQITVTSCPSSERRVAKSVSSWLVGATSGQKNWLSSSTRMEGLSD